MSDANPERGEHELVLAGTTYRLRPSFTACVAIERKTEHSLLELVRLGNTGGLSLSAAGVVAAELIKAGADDELNKRVSAERIGELIFGECLPIVLSRLTLCLLDAVNGGRDPSGEAKAPAA